MYLRAWPDANNLFPTPLQGSHWRGSGSTADKPREFERFRSSAKAGSNLVNDVRQVKPLRAAAIVRPAKFHDCRHRLLACFRPASDLLFGDESGLGQLARDIGPARLAGILDHSLHCMRRRLTA